MKNIAVILRGHYRTWEYNHKAAFKFYESIAENVEYYFVTWQFDGMNTKRITDSFVNNNQKLIKFITLDPPGLYYTSWHGPSWLNYNIIPYKKKRECEITYDAVFDTRPDIIYATIEGKPVLPPEPNTWHVTGYEPHFGHDGVTRHIGVQDHFFMSTSEVHDKMNLRHAYQDLIGIQAQELKLATDFGIKTAVIDWMNASIVRPTAFASVPNPDEYFTNPDWQSLQRDWVSMPTEQKLELLRIHNILREDYTTASIMAKL
jgi:hypothetical protein